MTKVDVVRAEMVKAMKAGDKERKNALSMLLSALKNATIDKRSDLTEEEADVIVRKEIKQTQETLDTRHPLSVQRLLRNASSVLQFMRNLYRR